jgi:tetratricopeptide (TPR) repeat protein
MDANLSQVCSLAEQYHRQGRLADAETCYRRALKLSPDEPDVLHALGVLSSQVGRVQEAVELIGRAIVVRPQAAHFHANLGEVYRRDGQMQEAVAHYRHALSLDPLSAQAHNNLGEAFRALGRADEAERHYRQAIKLQPEFAEALNNLGELCRESGRSEEALLHYDTALSFRADLPQIHNNRGAALTELDQWDSAIESLRQALSLSPDYVEAQYNLAAALRDRGDLEEAAESYQQALRIAPEHFDSLNNLGNTLRDLGKCTEAATVLDQAIKLQPDHAGAHYNRSLCWLTQGDFARGWLEHEWRWKRDESPPRHASWPLWRGESLSGKTILIHGKQGVGDEIMFASCVPDMIARAGRCVIECDPRLKPLLSRSFPAAEIVARCESGNLAMICEDYAIDVHSPAGNLPRYVRDDLSRFPQRERFLLAEAAGVSTWPRVSTWPSVSTWKRRLDSLGTGLKIGIAWRGGMQPRVKRLRSIPLTQWGPLFDLSGVHWISLQHGDHQQELFSAAQQYGTKIHTWLEVDPLRDLEEFASLICQLDLVISVDNTTVHMAGALGTPTWVALSQAADWRWLRERDDSPWYSSLRLFRQQRLGDWQDVLEHVANEIRDLTER